MSTGRKRITVITVETPEEDPSTAVFQDDEVEVEEHYISTYQFSKYSDGVELAAENLSGWLAQARQHEDPRVRAWYKEFAGGEVQYGGYWFRFIVDWELLVLVAYRDTAPSRETPWTSDEDVVAEAMNALTWSYENDRDHIEEYAAYALRAWAMAQYDDQIVTHIVLDFIGDGSPAMFVAAVVNEAGDDLFQPDYHDREGEALRAASDMRSTRLLTKVESEYRLSVQPTEDEINR